jgi:hypothetical protein
MKISLLTFFCILLTVKVINLKVLNVENNLVTLTNNSLIKKKIENFMIKAIKFSINMTKSRNKNSNSTCIDPDQAVIERKKIEMMKIFYDGFSILDYPAVSKVLDNLKLNYLNGTDADSLEYGSKECNQSSLKFLYDHQRSLCPWYYKVDYRNDRYPRTRMQAICNCFNCYYLKNKENDEDQFNCRQIQKLMPVLVRGDCIKGVYNWAVMFEYVSIACMCMKDNVLIDIDSF